MAAQKKDRRGRKSIPKPEQVVPVTIYIRRKNQGAARAECLKIAAKYR